MDWGWKQRVIPNPSFSTISQSQFGDGFEANSNPLPREIVGCRVGDLWPKRCAVTVAVNVDNDEQADMSSEPERGRGRKASNVKRGTLIPRTRDLCRRKGVVMLD